MKNEFNRILSVFLGGLIALIACELMWVCATDSELTIIRLIVLLIVLLIGLVIGLTLIKVGLMSTAE